MTEYLRERPSQIESIEIEKKFERSFLETVDRENVRAALDQCSYKLGVRSEMMVRHTLKTYEQFLEELKASSMVLMLHHITDPRNLGAIARSAAFFGIRHILVPQHRQVHYTQAGVSTAMGGFAYVDLVGIKNNADTATDLLERGLEVLAADGEGDDYNHFKIDKSKSYLLVLGSEDKGVGDKMLGIATHKLAIHGANRFDSLNVSVAAGVFLAKLCARV
jgi:tRNA G18 (ribose-2'-O)-methylase SpoU